MKKKNLHLRKRLIAIFSFMILIASSFNAWADDSAYCRWLYSGGANTLARFTWETTESGAILITIHSAIDGEAPLATAFRGDGWSDARVTGNLRVDGDQNVLLTTGDQNSHKYFNRTINADKTQITLTPNPGGTPIPAGATIVYNGATEYKTSLDGNAWPTITFTYTYGTDCSAVPEPVVLTTPGNLSLAGDVLTFTGDANAASHTAIVYSGSIPVYEQSSFTSGDAILFTTPGNYTVRVKSFGDGNSYYNSDFSEPVSWTIAGEVPVPGDSEFCHKYNNPSGNNDTDAFFITWETLANGNIRITLDAYNGNNPQFRGDNMNLNNLYIGPATAANGNTFLTKSVAGNVLTLSPKAGVTIPVGMNIRFQGLFYYQAGGLTNLAPNLTMNYTYGTNCENVVRTPLDKPQNVEMTGDVLTFDAVDNAVAYNAFIYLGTSLISSQIGIQSGVTLSLPIPGIFQVKVVAVPDPALEEYIDSEQSDPALWSVDYQTPATVPVSVYCDFLVDPNSGGNAHASDIDASHWSWTTDAAGQIVISIDRAVREEYTPTVKFRANGMAVANFRVGGISGALLLEKVGGNTGTTQTFRAREGVTLLPGIPITYSGQTEYQMTPTRPEDAPSAIHDLYPNLSFNTEFIYGSNCANEMTVLNAPTNLAISVNQLSFNPVTNATTYKVYVYNNAGVLVHTQDNFTSGSAIAYTAPGVYSVKVQAIGNASQYLSSGLSNPVEWRLIAQLATPGVLNVNSENRLIFTEVAHALSYTVTIYASADATTALQTIPNFVQESALDMGQANWGTTYYVKVQAIGDGDVILDSGLSAAYTWNFDEPRTCNALLQHPLISGSNEITFTKPDGTEAATAPYFAPGWNPSQDYTFTITDNVISIHLGTATGEDWQAQFRVLPDPRIRLKAGTFATIKATVKTSKSTPVYAKIFEYDDNNFIELIPRQSVNSTEGVEFKWTGTVTGDKNAIFQILFDFGKNTADTDIEISNIVICGEEDVIQPVVLDTPAGLAVDGENRLSFNSVSDARSYTVTIYESAGATTAVKTIPNFVSGSALDMGAENYGKTYYVKVQAIGDGVLTLHSELSEALSWTFEEVVDCNLLPEHPLAKGSTEITFTKPDGSEANTAPYYATTWNWVPSTNYTFDVTDNVASIHLGDATVAEWQAQFRILPRPAIQLKAGTNATIKFTVKTTKNTPVYAKIFKYDDNSFIEFARRNVNSTTGVEFTWSGVVDANKNTLFQILFDFGGCPANTDITISDISVCGEKDDVAIDKVNADPLTLYPVPAKDILYINGLKTATEVKIFDLVGKSLSVQLSNGTVDVSGLRKGIYILSVEGKPMKFTKD